METFARTLSRIRREAGYPTAYAFYHKNGGRRVFPFTYVHYLRFERAVSLPRAEWMPVLFFSLRLPQHSSGVRELSLAYLRALLRTEEAAHAVLEPLLAAPKGPEFAEASAARYRARQTVHLTPRQFEAIAADPVTYWCSEFLLNEEGSLTVSELALLAGAPAAKVRASLRHLVAAKLVRASSKDRYKARSPGRLYSFPGRLPGMKPALERIAGYWDAKASEKGGTVAWRLDLVRTSPARVAAFAGRLLETVDSAADLGVQTKGDDTGFYAVRAEIKKILSY